MITQKTIQEAQKLIGLDIPPAAQERLVPMLEAQLAGLTAFRALPLDQHAQPACRFDPRLPGRDFPVQADHVRLKQDPAPALPLSDQDIAFAPVVHLSHWLAGGQITSRRLTEIYLDRIARLDGLLASYITVTSDLALGQADACDAELAQGRRRGPLHGVPYGIKDVFDTEGVPTSWGSALFRDRVSTSDATIVTMLRDAGAVLLGKLGTGELANGSAWYGGDVMNPWNREEAAGGSSSGSAAAVAAGLCGFAIGTDHLGSILNPADRCGVVGLRATFGRIPSKGDMPMAPSLARIGPLCRRVEDAALVLAAIKGPDPSSLTSFDHGFAYDADIDLSGIKIGYSPDWFQRIGYAPEAATPVMAGHLQGLEAMRALGAELVEVVLPEFPYMLLAAICFVESAAVLEDLVLDGEGALISGWPDLWRQARLTSAVDYVQLDRLRHQLMSAMDRLFAQVDLLFAPAYGNFNLLLATNLTGHPGLTLRTGFGEIATRSLYGQPLDPQGPKHRVTANLTLHGRLFEEGKILAVARALEDQLDVWAERPPGF
ncbi:amidase [Caulobacter soli]|uniref:amidase n=1 Tax=Caulobacter soli TaxID=2708539 RepID=UPI0013EC0343|nr:amidase [Caulobacter soli]